MKDLDLPAEDQLILYNARIEIDQAVTEKTLRVLERPLDWNYIIKTANNHGVAPLLYSNLVKIGVEAVIPEELKAVYYVTASRNNRLLQETGRVLKAFGDAGIRSIILKGSYLINTVYKNPALRPLSDIDILILKEDLPAAMQILLDMGYILPPYLFPMEIFAKYNFHLPFTKRDDSRTIFEIHWDLRDNFKYSGVGLKSIWSNAVPAGIAGNPTLTMSPDDLLIYLCHHLERHGYMNRFILGRQDCYQFLFLNALSWNRLIWFVDIREVVNCFRENIHWEALGGKINKWDRDGSVASSLHLANRLFEMGLDEQKLRALTAPRVSFIESVLYKFIIKRALSTDWNKDCLLRFFKKRIIEGSRRFPFRPIRLIEINFNAIYLFIQFPLELAYYLVKRIFVRRAYD